MEGKFKGVSMFESARESSSPGMGLHLQFCSSCSYSLLLGEEPCSHRVSGNERDVELRKIQHNWQGRLKTVKS